MHKKFSSAAACVLLLATAPAHAALNYLGACDDARNSACVITDGSFAYLSIGGAKVTSSGLSSLLSSGWTLGSRADFAGMVARNAPLSTTEWNDAFLPDGPDADTSPDIVFGTAAVIDTFQNKYNSLILARGGDPVLAAAFKDIILKFGGFNANPAYQLGGLGTSDFLDATHRHTAGMQAYLTDAGVSISRNNTFSGALSDGTRGTAIESSAQAYFLLRDAASVAVVPEPESYAMMLAGLALIGAMARRRERVRD